jgi:hypothetical protein
MWLSVIRICTQLILLTFPFCSLLIHYAFFCVILFLPTTISSKAWLLSYMGGLWALWFLSPNIGKMILCYYCCHYCCTTATTTTITTTTTTTKFILLTNKNWYGLCYKSNSILSVVSEITELKKVELYEEYVLWLRIWQWQNYLLNHIGPKRD